MNFKCLFKGHSYQLVSSFETTYLKNPQWQTDRNNLVTCLLLRCENCGKIKEKKLSGIVNVPEHSMRD